MKTQLSLFCAFFCFSQTVCAQTWNALGPGLNGGVAEILPHNNGIYVCGSFTNAGGNPDADKLAFWNGNGWQSVSPITNSHVVLKGIAICEEDIYVIRSLNLTKGHPNHDDIARWNGQSWEKVGSLGYTSIRDIVCYKDALYIAGASRLSGGTPDSHYIRFLEGDEWVALNTPDFIFDNPEIGIVSLAADEHNLYVAGKFYFGPQTDNIQNIARWNGESWFPLDNGFWGDMGVASIAIDGSDIYAAGDGDAQVGSCGIVRWDGINWNPLGPGLSHCIYGEGGQVVAAANGHVIVSGNFLDAGDMPNTTGLAHWNGSTWNALGVPGFEFGFYPGTIAIVGDDVYVGGSFSQISGVPNASFIARWGEPQKPTGIDQVNRKNPEVLIYPNPSVDIISYEFGDYSTVMHDVTLINCAGKEFLKRATQETHLEISHLPTGVYFITIATDHITASGKFVKL